MLKPEDGASIPPFRIGSHCLGSAHSPSITRWRCGASFDADRTESIPWVLWRALAPVAGVFGREGGEGVAVGEPVGGKSDALTAGGLAARNAHGGGWEGFVGIDE